MSIFYAIPITSLDPVMSMHMYLFVVIVSNIHERLFRYKMCLFTNIPSYIEWICAFDSIVTLFAVLGSLGRLMHCKIDFPNVSDICLWITPCPFVYGLSCDLYRVRQNLVAVLRSLFHT